MTVVFSKKGKNCDCFFCFSHKVRYRKASNLFTVKWKLKCFLSFTPPAEFFLLGAAGYWRDEAAASFTAAVFPFFCPCLRITSTTVQTSKKSRINNRPRLSGPLLAEQQSEGETIHPFTASPAAAPQSAVGQLSPSSYDTIASQR